MKKIFKFSALLALCVAMVSAVSCQKNDLDTNQFVGGPIVFSAMSPNPVVRGAQLHIVGANLEKVTKVEIQGADPITNIKVLKEGAKSEIEITVPAVGPVPGKVVLYDNAGNKASSAFDLEFDESDFRFTSFEPQGPVWPGDVITIHGEFLNTMAEVIFSDGVYATGSAIFDVTRNTAKVIVPDHAITGPIQIGNADEVANPAAVAVVFQSEDYLIVGGPSIGNAGEVKAKAGDVITFTGEYLKMIKTVWFENAEATEFTTNDSGSELYVTLPAEAQEGTVYLVDYAGMYYEAGYVIPVLPNNLRIKPETRYKAGLNAIITADDLDLVTGVTFSGEKADFKVDELDGGSCIVATIPATAPDGDVYVSLASGVQVLVASVEFVKPTDVEVSVDAIVARETFNLAGEDLDLIANVSVGGIDCEIVPIIEKIVESEDEFGDPVLDTLYSTTSLDVVTDPTILTGDVVIFLENGYSEAVGKMTVSYDEPITIQYKNASIQLGQNLELTGVNLFQIAKISIKGKLVNTFAKRTDTEMSFALPDKLGPGVYRLDIELIDGTQLTWAVPFEMTAPYTEKYIWEGNLYLDSWGVQEYLGAEGALEAAGACEGDIVRIYFKPEKEGWVFQLFDGHWNGMSVDELGGGNEINASVDNGEGYFAFVLTPALLAQLNSVQGWGGTFVTNGDGVTYTGISLIHWGAAETEDFIWEGSLYLDSWVVQEYLGAEGAIVELGAAAGDKMRIYFTPEKDGWVFQLFDGHWNGMSIDELGGGNEINAGNFAGGEYFEFVLTDAIIAQLGSVQGWGGTFVTNGDGVTYTGISLVKMGGGGAVENVVWEGEAIADAWGNQPYVLDEGTGPDIGFEEGATFRVYFEKIRPDDPMKIECVEGHWGPTYWSICSVGADTEDGKFTETDASYYDCKITADMAAAAAAIQYWGGIFVFNGDNCKVTAISIL